MGVITPLQLLSGARGSVATAMLASFPTNTGADLGDAVWIDLVSPTAEEVERAKTATGLRIPSEAQVREIESTSRLALAEGVFTLSMPLVAEMDELAPRSDVGFVLSGRALVTLRFGPSSAFDAARATLASGATADAAFLKVLEVLVDRTADQLEKSGADCDDLTRRAFGRRRGLRGSSQVRTLEQVGAVADRTSRIRDSLLGMERIASFVSEAGSERAHEGAPTLSASRIKAIRADLASLTEYQAHLSGKIQFLLDATLGFINVEQNEIVKTLTIASVIGIPPVLVAGIYGMNFRHMPELEWGAGYPLAIGFIVASGLLPLVWFRRKGWM